MADLEKLGLARLKEALEAHEWDDAEIGNDLPDDFELGKDEADLLSAAASVGEDPGAREPILPKLGDSSMVSSKGYELDVNTDEGGEDDDVQELESMMLKLQAAKDLGADLPEVERRKLAAKAVGDVMRRM